MRKKPPLPLLALAFGLGLLIAWVDSRPTWDDTGITVGLVFLASALFGALRPSSAWLWALAIGVWVPLWDILARHNYGSLLALIVALLGAYGGAFARRAMGLFLRGEGEGRSGSGPSV
jgi:hypothetical protein